MSEGTVRRMWSYFVDLMAFLVTPKGRAILIVVGVGWFAYYLLSGTGGNPKPKYRIENAAVFVWPKGCNKAAVDKAIADATGDWGGSPIIPCACASTENEIKDWEERGLQRHSVGYKFSYYRIENDAAGVEIRLPSSKNPICFYKTYKNQKLIGLENFFVVSDREQNK